MEIKDRIALVTGASGGIGLAVCKALLDYAPRAIAMVDINDTISDAARQVNAQYGDTVAVPYCGNVTEEDFRRQVFDDISTRYQDPVRICVPAAGVTRDALAARVDRETGKVHIYPVEQFRTVVEINLIAPVYWGIEMVARVAEDRFARGLKKWYHDERIQGTVVFIGSISSQGNKGQISYASTKAGLEGAASTLTKEAIFHGIRCCVIHPGFTDTPMVRALGDEYIEKHILPDTQLGRLINPDEIAGGICFLISNSAVSGALWADAGWHPSAM